MIKLSKEQILEVYKRVVDDLGYHGDATLHESYSGRAMYGRTTLGISGDFSEELMYRLFLEAVADICDSDPSIGDDRVSYWCAIDEVCSIVDDIYPRRQDSLGLGKIYYR